MKMYSSVFKKLLLPIYVLLGVAFFMSSCSKDDNFGGKTMNKSKDNSLFANLRSWTPDFTVEDGIAVFDERDDAYRNMAHLDTLSADSIIAFSENTNFYSQLYILQSIIVDEQAEEYAVVSPYLALEYTEAQIIALNLTIPKSDVYADALSKGLLNVEEDSDTAHIYGLSLWNSGVASIVNEDGFVMIDDTLWQYKDTIIRFCTFCDTEKTDTLTKADTTNSDGTIVVLYRSGVADCNNWDGDLEKAYTSTGDKKRARFRRYGEGCISEECQICFMTVKFYLRMEAQQKKWGNWKYRNSYCPTFRFDDNEWTGGAGYGACSGGGVNALYLSGFGVPIGVTTFPMVNRRWKGNNGTGVKLHNHSDGQWPTPCCSNCWKIPMQINKSSLTDLDGRISGGTDLTDG